MLDPVHDVEVLGAPWVGERILVENIGDQSVVPVGGELVGDEVCIFGDAQHIWDEEDGLARLGVGRLRDVGIDRAIVDGGSSTSFVASEVGVKIGF